MKRLVILLILFFAKTLLFAQVEKNELITPEMVVKFKQEIEKQIPALKAKLLKEETHADRIEFILDTFRINELAQKRMDVDFTTQGMNFTINQQTAFYDNLMNKYYNKLLKKLIESDKKILISAQKSWIAFRDSETKLIWNMTDKKYSGGGTIQSNIANMSIADLVIKRTLELFNYFITIVEVGSR